MNYYLDTEFIEGFHKPLFGKRRHFIDLISIGIVAEDGREYYAISKDFNPAMANNWVKENVISKLEPRRTIVDYTFPGHDHEYESEPIYKDNPIWKSNKQITIDILRFIKDPDDHKYQGWDGPLDQYIDQLRQSKETNQNTVFYGYYADYDWVLFCSLFGRMIDLPKGFPMYCRDLKQDIDRIAEKWMRGGTPDQVYEYRKECERLGGMFTIDFNNNFNDILTLIKNHKFYPKQVDEHNALADARWNKSLHEFITIHL